MDQNLVEYVDSELEFRRLCGLETSGLCDLWTRILWNMQTMDQNLMDYVDYELESSRPCGLWTMCSIDYSVVGNWTMDQNLVDYVDYGLQTSELYGL